MMAYKKPHERLSTICYEDLPRYSNQFDPTVRAIERQRYRTLNGEAITPDKTNLIGALVRYEPSFQHLHSLLMASAGMPHSILGALGTALSGKWQYRIDRWDYIFADILWYGFGYSTMIFCPSLPGPMRLITTVRVVGLTEGIK